MEWAFFVVPPILGFLSRRWMTILLPLVGNPLYAIGLNRGWWGCCGTGDEWEFFTGVVTVAAVLVTGAAVQAGQRFANRNAKPV